MKKYKLFGVILLTGVLFISGCGNNNKKVVDGNKDDPTFTTKLEDEGGSWEYGAGYGFTNFDLEIDIDGVDTIEIDYKVDNNVKAEYVNALQDFHLKENEAMSAIHELFQEIRITKDTPEEEVIQKILQSLHIDHYSKFELEVDFDEGTELVINDTK